MYKSAKRFSVLKRILDDGILLTPKKVRGLETIRTYAGAKLSLQQECNTNSFGEVLKFRRQQARRTILIQINASKHCEELLEYLRAIGKVKMMYHYHTPKALHLALVEMEDEKSFYNVLDHAQNVQNQIGTSYTNFLWFKPMKKYEKTIATGNSNPIIFNSPVTIGPEYKNFNFLKDITSIRTTMFELHENSKINDLGFRLRFLTTQQLEASMKFINPSITVLPFGSSITGFGTIESDIDMVALVNGQNENKMSNLLFHVKSFASDRTMEQIHVQLLFEIIKVILPGCSEAFPITNARVPIVRYRQDFTSLECDISLYKMDSILMSELLFFLSTLDYRIKFLVFLARHWARANGLTSKTPDKRISNFCLTMLVLHFLQQKDLVNPPLVPPLNEIYQGRTHLLSKEMYADLYNKFSANCINNKQPIEELLLYFFKFYSQFNFADLGIDVLTAEKLEKHSPALGPLLVKNPLEQEHNIAKNVGAKEVMKIRSCMKSSFETLDAALKLEEINKISQVPLKDKFSEDHLVSLDVFGVNGKTNQTNVNINFERLMGD